jgi:pimeloyl-ACP methyl ester carboxylesterase
LQEHASHDHFPRYDRSHPVPRHRGTGFAYRRFGTPAGTPLVFTQHFMGNLDNFDPAISDALAAGREIILFDNADVGRSTGTAPDTIAGRWARPNGA